MATLERRVEELEKRVGRTESRQIWHYIEGYVFDVDEDAEPIKREFVELHGINLEDGNDHRFVRIVRSRKETEWRIAEGRERTPPAWREEPEKFRARYKKRRECRKFYV